MVDIDDIEIKRFPWTYTRHEHIDALGHHFPIYRVRLDLLIVENRDSLTLFDIDFFSQQDDMISNCVEAKLSGHSAQFGVTYILVTPSSFPKIYEEINQFELLCASHQ